MTPALAAIVAYLALQFGIGIWVSRRIRNETDYLLAGRNLGYVLATFSIFATWFGAETVMGSAGNAYRDGVSLANAEPFGYGLCLIVMGLVFARPLWKRQLTTLADLFRQRYSIGVERLAAIILVPGSILWAAAQIRAFGHVLATATEGIPIDVAIAGAAGFTMLYTMFGGLLVDAITDLIQGSILVVGLVVVLAAVLGNLQDAGGAVAVLRDAGPVTWLPAKGVSPLAFAEEWAIPICGSVVATELVGRVIATRTPDIARRSSFVAGGLYIAIGIIPLMIGLLGQQITPGLADAEQVVPAVASYHLPTIVYAIFAGGLISAILSTVDSTLLVASGLMSHNLIVPVFAVTEERSKVRIARGGVLLFGAVAYVQAVRAEGVFELVEEASAFGSAGVLVTVCFALFTSLGGARTAAATLLLGVTSYLVASFAGHPYPFLISLTVSLATYAIGASTGSMFGLRRHA
ncbi:MAG TPA: sodium:solute symporter family protein [Gemmatimonadaceae bacterium]